MTDDTTVIIQGIGTKIFDWVILLYFATPVKENINSSHMLLRYQHLHAMIC